MAEEGGHGQLRGSDHVCVGGPRPEATEMLDKLEKEQSAPRLQLSRPKYPGCHLDGR